MFLWILFTIGFSAIITLAGLAAEHCARLLHRPRRWGWCVALVIGAGWPIGVAMRGVHPEENVVLVTEHALVMTPAVAAPSRGSRIDVVVARLVNMPRMMTAAVSHMSAAFSCAHDVATRITRTLDTMDTMDTIAPAMDRWIILVWCIGSALLLMRAIRLLWTLHGTRRHWQTSTIDGVPVQVSDRIGPAVIGFGQFDVVLPAWVLELDTSLRALILCHEEEHRTAGDPYLLALGFLCTVCLPWNPFIWWQVRRLRLAIEIDCDARVLRAFPSRERYGLLLLAIAQRRANVPPFVAALAKSPSHLSSRITAMRSMNHRASRTRPVLLGGSAVAIAIAAINLPVPAMPRHSLRSIRAAKDSVAAVMSSSSVVTVAPGSAVVTHDSTMREDHPAAAYIMTTVPVRAVGMDSTPKTVMTEPRVDVSVDAKSIEEGDNTYIMESDSMYIMEDDNTYLMLTSVLPSDSSKIIVRALKGSTVVVTAAPMAIVRGARVIAVGVRQAPMYLTTSRVDFHQPPRLFAVRQQRIVKLRSKPVMFREAPQTRLLRLSVRRNEKADSTANTSTTPPDTVRTKQ